MYKSFIEMLSVLLTVGGVGIINYIIAEQLDAVDITQQGSNREKALAIIFSMFDLLLYLAIEAILGTFMNGRWLILSTVLLTIVISVAITIKFASRVNKAFYTVINKVRGDNGKSFRRSKTTWQSSFDLHGHRNQMVYLYDFDHNPLGFGWRLGISNDGDTNYAVTLMPQFDDSDPEDQPSYEEICRLIQQDNYQQDFETKQFVSFKQRFIAIISTYKQS